MSQAWVELGLGHKMNARAELYFEAVDGDPGEQPHHLSLLFLSALLNWSHGKTEIE